MSKARVMVATPVKGGIPAYYLNGLVGMLKSLNDADYIPAISYASYINVGRNELVEQAIAEKCDEICFIDSDMEWTVEHLKRIREHDVDIVGGVYCKRKSGPPDWTFHPKEGAEYGPDCLIECNDVAAGFLRIKMQVFETIKAKNPRRLYQHKGQVEPRCEYFPIGLVGPNTAEGRLQAIEAALSGFKAEDDALEGTSKILAILAAEQPPSELLGEDVFWCRLAREAGFKVWADLGCRLRHDGFPLTHTPL